MRTMYGFFHPESGAVMVLFDSMTTAILYSEDTGIDTMPATVAFKPEDFVHRCAKAAGDAWIEFLKNRSMSGPAR